MQFKHLAAPTVTQMRRMLKIDKTKGERMIQQE